ncbi:MAG: hypothetical protein IIB95_14380 [Candidatus Marinimicrobia bacterium]|nr:hypothetical protein [Candidatus Neomarinimicrobiota bacterium]
MLLIFDCEKSKKPTAAPLFLQPVFELHLIVEFKKQNLPNISADSAVPGLNRNMAYLNKMILPPENILNEFDDLVKPLFNKIETNKNGIETLTQTRDTLLPKLVSGEIVVK